MKRSYLGICMLCIFFMCGCGNSKSNIYNDDKKIAADSDTFSISNSEGEVINNEYKEQLTLDGDYTIWQCDCDSDRQTEVAYSLKASNGSAKLVLITPDNKVNTIVQVTDKKNKSEMTKVKLDLGRGKNRIK